MELQEELFCEDGFDCYAWAEEALIERSGRVGDLAQLVPQLALLSQSLSKSIHGTLHQLAVTAPQLQTQLDALQTATTPLRQQLDAVVAHVGEGSGGDANANTASWSSSHRKKEEERALEHLVTLHDAKQRLQACSQALVEAAKWEKNVRVCFTAVDEIASGVDAMTTTTSSSINGANEGKDGEHGSLPLADRVCEMRKSLEVLGDLPGADDRHSTMRSLCTHIESKLTPMLLEHLREPHLPVPKIQRCLEIFTSVDRAEIVQEEYCKCRPGHVHRYWYTFNPEEQEFAAWLEGFYAEVLTMLQRESQHIHEIFGRSKHKSLENVLIALLDNTFASLRVSFEDRLKQNFKMARLLRAFQLSSAFAVQVAQLFRALGELNASESSSTSLDVVGSNILSSIFDAYRPFFSEYSRYASTALSDELSKLVPKFTTTAASTVAPMKKAIDVDDEDGFEFEVGGSEEGSLEEFAQRFEDASNEVWALVDESIKHCYEFSAGAAFPEAIVAVTNAVQQFARALSATIPSIRQFCNIAVASETRGVSASSDHFRVASAAAAAPDWSKFHAALALLKACGTFESDLCAMEIRVRARVQEQLSHFLDGEYYADRQSSSPRSSRKKEKGGGSNGRSLAGLLAADGNNAQVAAIVVKTWLHDDASRNSQFLQFAHEYHRSNASFDASTLSRAVLFEEAQLCLREWTDAVQLLTFDTVFLPISRLLEKVPTNEVQNILSLASKSWIKIPDAFLGDLPSFSTLPQEYITTVADLLLSLLPQLEQFAESSSLPRALVASRGAQQVCVLALWSRLGSLLRLSEQEIEACMFIFAPEGSDAVNDEQGAPVEDRGGASSPSSAANEFVDLWTSVVASGTLAALLSAMCAIPALSDLGARQLSADLSYFHNVLSAVSGDQNFIVDDLRHSLELSSDEHAQHAEQLREEHELDSSQVLAKINESLVGKRVKAASTSVNTMMGAAAKTTATGQFY